MGRAMPRMWRAKGDALLHLASNSHAACLLPQLQLALTHLAPGRREGERWVDRLMGGHSARMAPLGEPLLERGTQPMCVDLQCLCCQLLLVLLAAI